MADEKLPSYPNVEHILINDKDVAPPAQVVKHANDADEAMKAFEGHDGELLVLDEATNKRLLRKIDLNILPVCAARSPRRLQERISNIATATMHSLWSQLP